ncbi:MAG: EAL domain-containing protein [Tissierellia bacterium]|nr:EAL domain-containing protein [Tissierellia bacterium]
MAKKRKFKFEFQEIIDMVPSVMLVIDAESGEILELNKAAVDYYGYSKEQILNMNISDFNLLSQGEIMKEMALALKERRYFFNFKHRLADNSIREVEVHSFPIKYGKENLLFSTVYDVHDKLEQKLMFEQLLLASPYAVAILDKDQKIVKVNKDFTKMFLYDLEETKGKFINKLISPYKDSNQIDKNLEVIYKGQIVKQEGKRRRKDGKLMDVEIIGYPVLYNQTVIGVYAIYIDISHKYKDHLTQLHNRNYFVQEINKSIENYPKYKEGFSVLALYIEGFREINDTLGHIIADEFLVESAKRLKVLVRQYLIAKIDSNEFAILVNSTNKNYLLYLSNAILESLSKPFIISNTKIYLNFKIGISSFPGDGRTSEELIRFSNTAMHQSEIKSNQRISFYDNKISEEMEERFFIVNYLFSAISNKELSIHYQPIFSIKDRTIVGAEALLRWNNPELGQVAPNTFIPIAEKTGQILSIGEWVIEEVCKQINLWKIKGFKLIPISINISVKQLENVNFAKSLMQIIKNTKADPKNIELEITESVSSGDIERIVKNIKELKKYGIKISMDDFGTGFSSLGQLDIFELDKLKIDKIFVDDLGQGLRRQNLVKTIISMAENLDLITVAEGIETQEQLCHLKGLGCQQGQGFIFSKPLTVEQIEKFLVREV